MKTFIKFISVLAIAVLAAAPAARAEDSAKPPSAQPDHPRMQQMRENRMKQLDEKLHLTADQKTKIEAIWDKAQQAGQAIRQDEAASRRERRAKMREAMKATHLEVRGVLTPEQQKIFDAMPRGNARGMAQPAAPAAGATSP